MKKCQLQKKAYVEKSKIGRHVCVCGKHDQMRDGGNRTYLDIGSLHQNLPAGFSPHVSHCSPQHGAASAMGNTGTTLLLSCHAACCQPSWNEANVSWCLRSASLMSARADCIACTPQPCELQRGERVGKDVAAQTTAGNPKKHTPRRKASPRARTNDARTGAHKQVPKAASHDKKHRMCTEAAGTEQHTQHQTALSASKALAIQKAKRRNSTALHVQRCYDYRRSCIRCILSLRQNRNHY